MGTKTSIAFIFLVFFLLEGFVLCSSNSRQRCKDNERRALLDFKQGVIDRTNTLSSSWVGLDCCTWKGVGCDDITGHVVKLDLPNPIHFPGLSSPTSQPDLSGEDYNEADDGYVPAYNEDFDAYVDVVQVRSSLVELKHLQHLDLSSSDCSSLTRIPDLFGLFHELRYLNLSSGRFGYFHVEFRLPNWWKNLENLEILDLSQNSFSGSIPTSLMASPKLRELHLQWNSFHSPIPLYLPRTLEILDLSHNSFYGPIPTSLGSLSRLKELHLHFNSLNGSLPNSLGKMLALEVLDLGSNDFSGQIPVSLGELINLKLLDLTPNPFASNFLSGQIPVSIENMTNLEHLRLCCNQLSGQIPINLGTTATKLIELDLANNQLNGEVPVSLGQLSQLTDLNLSNNTLSGVVTEMHFAKLSKLSRFDVSLNPLIFKIRDGWVLPFSVSHLDFQGCHVGPKFPSWIQSQTELISLSMPNSGISDSIPKRFFHNMTKLKNITLSGNQIHGTVPDFLPSEDTSLDLGSNNFAGSLPHFSSNITTLNLSDNNITGTIDGDMFPRVNVLDLSNNRIRGSIPDSLCQRKSLRLLDLSKNQLSGILPHCLGNMSSLEYLDLSSNYMSGLLPTSIGHLQQLSILLLSNNKFHGEFPQDIQHLLSLYALDLGENAFSGKIPYWIGERLTQMAFLKLSSNIFSGRISPQLCGLYHLQVLDLARNNLSGSIPHCFSIFASMIGEMDILNYTDPRVKMTEEINGKRQEYTRTLIYLVNLDLSSNHLVGQIPHDLPKLSKLLGLNLSRNQLTGNIPQNIGQMSSLISLDFSQNNLSGEIPQSISSLSKLSHLNLSHNHLSGTIPSGNQLQTLRDPSIYEDNNLCGLPLEKKCPGGELHHSSPGNNDKENTTDSKFFYLGLLSGFIVGAWGVFCVMLFKKTWRHSYFRFVDDIKLKLLVAVELRIIRTRNKMKHCTNGSNE